MTIAGPVVETEEAREMREAYNKKYGHNSTQQPHESEEDYMSLPCSAGVVWVNLTELEEQENKAVAEERPAVPVRRRSFLSGSGGAASSSSAATPPLDRQATTALEGERALGFSGAALIARLLRMRLKWGGSDGAGVGRRNRRNSQQRDDASGGAKDAAGRQLAKAKDEEAVALELLNFVVEPAYGAEEAKASATQAAIIRQTYVTQELQVRAMWRVTHGNAPGLKAEIAKLHATERAKLAFRQFELDQAARRSRWKKPIAEAAEAAEADAQQHTKQPPPPPQQQQPPPQQQQQASHGGASSQHPSRAAAGAAGEGHASQAARAASPIAVDAARQDGGRGFLGFSLFNPRRPSPRSAKV